MKTVLLMLCVCLLAVTASESKRRKCRMRCGYNIACINKCSKETKGDYEGEEFDEFELNSEEEDAFEEELEDNEKSNGSWECWRELSSCKSRCDREKSPYKSICELNCSLADHSCHSRYR